MSPLYDLILQRKGELQTETVQVVDAAQAWRLGRDTERVKFWKLWARALGEKASTNNKEADRVALIRTIIVLYAITVDTFILLNILFGWYSK